VKQLHDIQHLKFEKGKLILKIDGKEFIFQLAKISKKLKSRYPNLQIFNTICNATELRQNSAKSLSKKVDMMIVIGGKKSSNTKKLFEVCKKTVPTHLIETVHDLQKNLFKNINIVGVTAGASTPDWIIKEVLDYINKI